MLGLLGAVPGRLPGLRQGRQPSRSRQAVDQAKSVSPQGSEFASDFDAAKAEWEAKYDEGKALVVADDRAGHVARVPQDDQRPPPRPGPRVQPRPEQARRTCTSSTSSGSTSTRSSRSAGPTWPPSWFTTRASPRPFKNRCTRSTARTPPAGEGWIIQIVGHHYNPTPTARGAPTARATQRKAFGPFDYLVPEGPAPAPGRRPPGPTASTTSPWPGTSPTRSGPPRRGPTATAPAPPPPLLDRATAAGRRRRRPGGAGMPGGPGCGGDGRHGRPAAAGGMMGGRRA